MRELAPGSSIPLPPEGSEFVAALGGIDGSLVTFMFDAPDEQTNETLGDAYATCLSKPLLAAWERITGLPTTPPLTQ